LSLVALCRTIQRNRFLQTKVDEVLSRLDERCTRCAYLIRSIPAPNNCYMLSSQRVLAFEADSQMEQCGHLVAFRSIALQKNTQRQTSAHTRFNLLIVLNTSMAFTWKLRAYTGLMLNSPWEGHRRLPVFVFHSYVLTVVWCKKWKVARHSMLTVSSAGIASSPLSKLFNRLSFGVQLILC